MSPGGELVQSVLAGDHRAIGRAITLLEREDSDRSSIVDRLYRHAGGASIVGLTGPPGAGKSTLLHGLVRCIRATGQTVGVLAVDPSSPLTGGAVLGDRVRMQAHSNDPGVYIRSMGARGQLGGLAAATNDAVHVLDAAGFGVVLIETVGVGQSEWDVVRIADTTVVIVTPTSGDTVQFIKAGLLEMADIFVVNKADIEGAARMARDLHLATHTTAGRTAPILQTVSTSGLGLDVLWAEICRHNREAVEESRPQHQGEQVKAEIMRLALNRVQCRFEVSGPSQSLLESLSEQVVRGEIGPHEAASRLLR